MTPALLRFEGGAGSRHCVPQCPGLCGRGRYLRWRGGPSGPLGRAITGFPQVTSAGEGLGPAGSLIFAVFFSKERISRWSWAGPPSCGRRRRRWRRRGGGRGHLFVLVVFVFLLLTLLCQGNLVTFSITAMFFSAVGPQVGRAGAGRWVEHLYSAGRRLHRFVRRLLRHLLRHPPSSSASSSSSRRRGVLEFCARHFLRQFCYCYFPINVIVF